METKALILGLGLSLGVFAVKSGAGLSYILRRRGWPAAVLFFATVHAPVFWTAWFVSDRIKAGAYLDRVLLVAENGMALHLLLAALLLVWGVTLLGRCGCSVQKSRGWLLLSLPCPVCFLVIITSGAMAETLMPKIPWLFAYMYAGFVATGLASAFILSRVMRRTPPEHGLGALMVLASLYFLLTVTFAPQMGEVERIYRLSREAVPTAHDNRRYMLLGGFGLAFAAGFATSMRRLRWK